MSETVGNIFTDFGLNLLKTIFVDIAVQTRTHLNFFPIITYLQSWHLITYIAQEHFLLWERFPVNVLH